MASRTKVEAEADVTNLNDLLVHLIKEGNVEATAKIDLELIKHSPQIHRVTAQEVFLSTVEAYITGLGMTGISLYNITAIRDIFHSIQPVPPDMKENSSNCCLVVCDEHKVEHNLECTDIVYDHCKTLAKEGSFLKVVYPKTVTVMGVRTRGSNPQSTMGNNPQSTRGSNPQS